MELVTVPFQDLIPTFASSGSRHTDVLAFAWEEENTQSVTFVQCADIFWI